MDVREKLSSEKRLIDADRAMEIVRNQGIAHPNAYHLTNYATLILREAPTVDAVEVVHGRWRCHGDCGVTECSVCGWSIEEYVGDYAYCPNCGSDMRGSNDE